MITNVLMIISTKFWFLEILFNIYDFGNWGSEIDSAKAIMKGTYGYPKAQSCKYMSLLW